MKTIRHILLLCLQVIAISGICQEHNIRFQHLTTEQGLSQSNVFCILQDSRGFMWFGTREGLNKYDGYKFIVYKNDPQDKNSLSDNYVPDIFENSKGKMWVATRGGGLNYYDRDKDKFTNYKHDLQNKNSICSNLVLTVFEDSDENVWAGTEDGGLSMLDQKTNKFTNYCFNRNDSKSLGDNYVRDIFEDSQHNLWVATNNGGLNLFDRQTKTFKRFQHDDGNSHSISGNSVSVIFEDSKHRLWTGMNGGGINLFNLKTGGFSYFKNEVNNTNSLPSNVVYAITEDSKGNLWIGTENGGLSVFNPETKEFTNYTYDEFDNSSLSNNSIYSIYKDSKDNMWLGTFNAGLNIENHDAEKFTYYKHIPFKNSLCSNKVWTIYEDSKSNIWIGTDGDGLDLFDPKTGVFTNYKHQPENKNSICGNHVLSIHEDYKGNLWVGTWGEGLTVFNRGKNSYKHFRNDPANKSSISSNNAWTIFEDRDKNMWVGTPYGGLNLYNPGNDSFTRYEFDEANPSSLSNNNVQNIFEDSDGYLWISTKGGGLNRFDKKKKIFTRFLHDDKKNSISNNSVGAVYEDGNGVLWISTMIGLNSLDRKTSAFTVYTTKDGLPNNTIFGILEDNKKNLWISTDKGISRFNPAAKTFKNFGIADGLQSNEFKGAAFCKSRSGAMYFGGNNGFNQFYPYNIRDIAYDPPLVITGFQIFNKEVPITEDNGKDSPLKKDISETKEIILSHKNSVISFEFASLNFTSPEKKQYTYMLEGFDKSWNEVGTQHTATYTNLDAGTYIFKVKGMNNDGSWSSAITSVKLTITPPFWLTWWFKTLAMLFVTVSLVAIFRIRIKAIKKQKILLEKQVNERTAEVVLQKEVMNKNIKELDRLRENLEKEKYFLDALMDNMPDAIYFKDPESKLLRVSRFMADRFGGTVKSLIGKSDFDFQSEIHAKEAYEDEQNIQRTRKPKIDYIEKEINPDGSESWVSTTKMPLINSYGEVVGTFGISRDVTNLKKLEKEQHAAETDKAVAQGKFEIASEVMHDIGNAVVGFGSYLTRIKRMQEQENPEILKNLADFFEEKKSVIAEAIGQTKADAVIKMLNGITQTQRNNQEELRKSVSEQLNIITHIQEILDIQRQYITGHEAQERKPVNLRNIVSDCISMLLGSINKMAIAVSLDISPDLPAIKGDRTKLMQAILNIIKNSMEAIDKDATEKTITLSAYTNTNLLILQVKDNGNGFDKPTADQLFSRGFSTKSSSSGLGLYNCKSIIESHEGTINITSEGPGKGALTTIGFKI
ncbi:MAG: PAS domain S-box protein [Bacteroidia bacterium]|nr:PAS domain S-box protein [Bacteroidia bacterium]